MWLLLQQDDPGDCVIASGELHSVRDLVELAFGHVELDWQQYVHIDESLKRGAAELHDLVGDSTLARERLGWEPEVRFPELVRLLVDAELERLRGEAPTLTSP
jgi:GDPmannose 4,6-dehydratase